MQSPLAAALADFATPGTPRLLFVTHAWGGGVEQHVTTLSKLLRDQARVLILRPHGPTSFRLQFPDGTSTVVADWDRLVDALRGLRFERIHLHHVHGFPAALLSLDQQLVLPVDVTLHDYFAVCPQYQLVNENGQYCGEPDESGCAACVAKRPHAWDMGISEWRRAFSSLLLRAGRVFAPSESVAQGVRRYIPALNAIVVPHPEHIDPLPRVCKVVLLGALSPAKGLQLAIDVAAHARKYQTPLVLRLIGHAAEPLPDTLSATGSYRNEELMRLLASERPDVIWLPSQVPETYSFALSAALASGLPIVASDLGALGERLKPHERATLLRHDAPAVEWHDALLNACAEAPVMVAGAATAPATTGASDGYYTRDYAAILPHPVGAANRASLDALIAASAATTQHAAEAPSRALIDVFRIGAYGGHRESLHAVELEIATLPTGEAHVVGRAAHEAEVDRLENELDVQVTTALAQAQAFEAHIAHLEDTIDAQHSAMDEADQRAAAAREHIANIEQARDQMLASASWRLTRPLRFLTRQWRRSVRVISVLATLLRRAPVVFRGGIARYRRGGWRSVRERMLQELRAKPAVTTIALPSVEATPIADLALATATATPVVSIIIPVYGQHETTFACLKSIASHPPRASYEVIVMDDCSPEPAQVALAPVRGIRVLRNERNLGFIGNVNAGAAAATGDYLLILNNDTMMRPGALDVLIDTFEQHTNVGLVGAKLLNADGSVQEAGGIVWRDGSAWNWGRGQNRDDPRFNFVRDADYCSGAALAIRRELFAALGGFDSYYAPAYYEDTDLAFRIRQRGLRVIYQPAAEIFHLEGVSHGRDEQSGIKAYQVANAAKFFERWQRVLAKHRDNGVEPELEACRNARSRILIVEACMVTPDQDSGSVRMLNMMRLLVNDGHQVTFVADNLDGDARYRPLLTAIGVEVLFAPFARSVRAILTARGAALDTIVFCRHYIASQYMQSVRKLAPRARIVFDTVDLHFVREEREAELTASASMARAAAITRTREMAVITRCDVTLVVSPFERKLLSELAPAARVEMVSNIHVPTQSEVSPQGRSGILFVGGFRHPPNVDAVKWYAAEVLPHVRRLLPDVVTSIVGSNMPAEIAELEQDGLHIAGFINELDPVLRKTRVSIAPLRFGAGVKGKVNEAMNNGIAVVATTCAVEGMGLVPGRDVLVADDPQQFAEAIAALYRDDVLWATVARNGMSNVHAHFSMDAALPALRAVFDHREAR